MKKQSSGSAEALRPIEISPWGTLGTPLFLHCSVKKPRHRPPPGRDLLSIKALRSSASKPAHRVTTLFTSPAASASIGVCASPGCQTSYRRQHGEISVEV